MDKGTIIILDKGEELRDFPDCDEALLVVRITGEVLKDVLGIFIQDNAKRMHPLPGAEGSNTNTDTNHE